MRLVFIATGDIALPAFRHLLVEGPRPLALVTQPDKPVGRKQVMTPPRIKTEALEAGIPVLQPERIGDAAHQLRALEPEALVVMAYGQILKADILELPSKAIVNLHASLLPKYRGAACIQAAIDAGDAETGITAQHVVRKLDSGDLILAEKIAIAADETGGSLHDRLAELAVPVLRETLQRLADGTATRQAQDEAEASYIGKLGRDDGRIDWSANAALIERRVRAYDPWPGTYTTVRDGERVKRLKVFPPTKLVDQDAWIADGECCSLEPGEVRIKDGRMYVGSGEGVLELTTLQPDGSKRMAVADYLRGKVPERLT